MQSCPMLLVRPPHLPVGSHPSVCSYPVQRKHQLNHFYRWEWDMTATNWSKPMFSWTPLPTQAFHFHACSYLSHIVSRESRECCSKAESSSCLLMHTTLMWADFIRPHFWMPSFSVFLLLRLSLADNVTAAAGQTVIASRAIISGCITINNVPLIKCICSSHADGCYHFYWLFSIWLSFALIKQSHLIVCWKIISTLFGKGNVHSRFFFLALSLVFPKAVVILDL